MIEEIKTELRIHAQAIGAIGKRRLMARPSYDIMSDAIVWSDEIKGLPIQAVVALRPVFRFRTSQFVGQVDNQWSPVWVEAKNLFPTWIGFNLSRTNPGQDIVKLYERQHQEANCSIKEINQ